MSAVPDVSAVPDGHVDGVSVERSGHVALVGLHRPPANYFDADLVSSLARALEEVDADRTCRAAVLWSEGRHFCAGETLDGGDQDPSRAPLALYEQGIRLFRTRLPIVAAVQGAAVGGGLGLALAADFRVATPESRFDCNFARLGFHHGFGAALTLPAVVGRRALELLLTGGSLRGEAALGARLCDRVVPAEDLLDAASSWPPARLAGTALRTGDPAHDAGDVRRRRLGRDAGGGCRAGGARAERRLRRSRESDGRAACTAMVGALTVPASRGAGPRTAKVQDPSREEDRWR